MAASAVFLDTSGLLALVARDDGHHARAVTVRNALASEGCALVTSDWVLAEFLAGASRQPLRSKAVEFVRTMRSSPAIRVIEASRADWDIAFKLYADRADKDWSLVDCSSVTHCTAAGIVRVFSSDRHFAQAGFDVLIT